MDRRRRANVILDNLIAQNKIKPMIVVMPLGYGTMEMITRAWDAWSHQELVDRNFNLYTQILLNEVKPQAEKLYSISKDRKDHAIAGLSMGGGESLRTGLNHLDDFAYVGAFSQPSPTLITSRSSPISHPRRRRRTGSSCSGSPAAATITSVFPIAPSPTGCSSNRFPSPLSPPRAATRGWSGAIT